MTTDRLLGITGITGVKPPVRVATTANITLSGLQTIDGVALAAGDRVLVKNQTSAVENGIWDVSSGAWTRSLDFNGQRDAEMGTAVFVAQGSTNARGFFVLDTVAPVVGVSSLTFSPAAYSASVISSAMQPVVSAATLQAGRDAFGVSGLLAPNDNARGLPTSTGASGVYAVVSPTPIAAYAANQEWEFIAHQASAGADVFNADGIGTKTMKRLDGTSTTPAALAAGDIKAGDVVRVKYDGTDVIVLSGSATTLRRGKVQLTTLADIGAGTSGYAVEAAALKQYMGVTKLTSLLIPLRLVGFALITDGGGGTFAYAYAPGFSTVVRNSTGDYSLTFSSPLASDEYMVWVSPRASVARHISSYNHTTTGFSVSARDSGGTLVDFAWSALVMEDAL